MLTKENSLEIKGVAILLMLAFHLFGFPERTPEFSAAWLGSPVTKAFQICVPLFLFLGGYGLQCVAAKRAIDGRQFCSRIRKLYVNFWWICIPTILVGMSVDYYPIDASKMLMEVLGITSDFNGEWWFFSNYLELFLIFFVFQHILNAASFSLDKAVAMIVVMLVGCRLIGTYVDWEAYGIVGRHLRMILVNTPIFLLGSLFARYDLFAAIQRRMERYFNLPFFPIFLLVIPILVRAYLPLIGVTELFVVPMFCLGVADAINQIGGGKMLKYFGEHSMNMWLTHTFFIYYYMKDITFITTNSIVMYLTVILCSLTMSIVVERIKKITDYVTKLHIR